MTRTKAKAKQSNPVVEEAETITTEDSLAFSETVLETGEEAQISTEANTKVSSEVQEQKETVKRKSKPKNDIENVLLVQQSILATALEGIKRAVSAKTVNPVLANVMLVITTDQIKVLGSNLGLTIEATIKLKDKTTINTKTALSGEFIEVVKRCKGLLKITIKRNMLQIEDTNNSKFEFSCIDPSDFPEFSQLESMKPSLTLDTKTFIEMINLCKLSMAGKENYILEGIEVLVSNNVLKCQATNGHKVTQVSTKLQEVSQEERFVLRNGIVSNIDLLKNSCIVQLACEETHVMVLVQLNELTVVKILETVMSTQFPDIQFAVDNKCKKLPIIATMNTEDALNKLKQLDGVRQDKELYARLNFSKVGITATATEEMVSGQVDLAGECNSEFTILFNIAYLSRLIQSIQAEKVRLEMSSPTNITRLTPVDTCDSAEQTWELKHYLMPVQHKN
jgi:DNA polymerase-3 subunit beta